MTAYARRYPQSDLLDSYWYILAYCDFATGKHAAAIEMCRKVAEAQHLDKQSGRMVDSPNKYRAIYILGQIYQSLGQRADAIREYRRVERPHPRREIVGRLFPPQADLAAGLHDAQARHGGGSRTELTATSPPAT